MKNFTLICLAFVSIQLSIYAQVLPTDTPETIDTEIWNGFSWDSAFFTTITFNANCLPTVALFEQYDDSSNSYNNLRRDTQVYDTNSNPVTSLVEVWDVATSAWINEEQTITTITNNEIVSELTQIWDLSSSTWINASRDDYTHNSQSQVAVVTTLEWDTDNDMFVNVLRKTYTYFPNGLVDTILDEDYDTNTSGWVNSIRATYTYNGSDLVSELLSESWSGTEWAPLAINNFTYDSNDSITELLLSNWNATSMSYEASQRTSYTNNLLGQPTEILLEVNISGVWFNASRNFQTFPNCQTLSIEKDDKIEFEIFPNPFANTINLKVSEPIVFQLMEVFDLTGKTVFKTSANLRSLDLGHLEAGTYILVLQTATEKTTFKIVKQ
ncbi:T9SS type A sorting domain-containing protein [Winogradskyella sp.]|uniref:T9SS type A sorting domain-containing protein n=1 Tax=Winogradskyella sp. TaxID=1883156 RepID=UPI003BAA21C5